MAAYRTPRAESAAAIKDARSQPTQLVGVTLALVALSHTLTAIDTEQQTANASLERIASSLDRIATAMEAQHQPRRARAARFRRNRNKAA